MLSADGFSVVTSTRRLNCAANIIQNFERQEFSQKELIIIIHGNQYDRTAFDEYIATHSDITILQAPVSMKFGECLNRAYREAKYSYIAKFDDDDYYSPHYLQEAYHAFKQKQCDVVCKHSIFYYLQYYNELIAIPKIEESVRPRSSGAGATISMTAELFKSIQYSALSSGIDIDFFSKCRKERVKVYTTTTYNFICVRAKETDEHTWKVSSESLHQRADASFGRCKMEFSKACQWVDRLT